MLSVFTVTSYYKSQEITKSVSRAAEEYYPGAFRIAMGDDVLEALGDMKLVNAA